MWMYHPEAEPQLRLPIRTKLTDKSISEPGSLFRMKKEISRRPKKEINWNSDYETRLL